MCDFRELLFLKYKIFVRQANISLGENEHLFGIDETFFCNSWIYCRQILHRFLFDLVFCYHLFYLSWIKNLHVNFVLKCVNRLWKTIWNSNIPPKVKQKSLGNWLLTVLLCMQTEGRDFLMCRLFLPSGEGKGNMFSCNYEMQQSLCPQTRFSWNLGATTWKITNVYKGLGFVFAR